MKINEERIIVCCPHAVTGGPELLHQLVHELREMGRNAFIAYYPFENTFECPEPYKKYNAPQSSLIDEKDTFVLVPETATWIIKRLKKSGVGVWWLSVDNYLRVRDQSKLKDLYHRLKGPMRMMLLFKKRRLVHFTQSRYAEVFLAKAGISSAPLTDYLGSDHLARPSNMDAAAKENIVAFNPKKGYKKTMALIDAYPHIQFIPIQNMTPMQVAEFLGRSKIYIDFGHHPGKDRPPREAAMAGCCVITGRKGSAHHYEDMPIPDKYKLDDSCKAYLECFGALAEKVFENYDDHSKDFDGYRTRILKEQDVFKQQVRQIFG